MNDPQGELTCPLFNQYSLRHSDKWPGSSDNKTNRIADENKFEKLFYLLKGKTTLFKSPENVFHYKTSVIHRQSPVKTPDIKTFK